MYQVFDNGKPADRENQKNLTNDAWKTSKFSSLAEAVSYACSYFHPYSYPTEVNTKVDYNEYGDTGEIREVK